MEEILKVLPIEIKEKVKNKLDGLEEIRIRVNKPVILQYGQAEEILHYIVDSAMILSILQNICDNSIYAYQEQICNGYVTIKGGHRVGITGNVVIKENKVINISYINGLNFRIARQVLNCSYKAIKYIINLPENTIYNTIIVSPPGRGKTTILRDLIRIISKTKTVGVVDERGEIAAMYKGAPQNDVGIRTDIIENVSKNKGIHMLIRTMAPEIIACDEIGSKEDVEAIHYALYSGVKGIFTMHGKNVEDIKNNKQIYELIENREIHKIIFL